MTDISTNCRERLGPVRLFYLPARSRLSAADFPRSAPRTASSIFIKANLKTLLSQSGCRQPTPQPPAPQPAVQACSLCHQGYAGMHPELSSQQSQPPGPRAGKGKKIKGSMAPSIPVAHLKSASQRGSVVPILRLPLATLYSPDGGTGQP